MTIDRSEVHFEPEFYIPSHQIRQCCYTYSVLKTEAKPKAEQGKENQTSKESPGRISVLGDRAGAAHFTTPMQARLC